MNIPTGIVEMLINKKCFTWSMGNTSDAEHMFQDVTDLINPHKYTLHKHKINK